MGEIPDRPKTRRGRRVVGTLRTGLHTVTVQMRRPSRYVPLMVAVGLGAFASFGWPIIAWTQGPHVSLDDQMLSRLVEVHRGSADTESLEAFTGVKALVLFEALPAPDKGSRQGSFAVLRASRVSLNQAIAQALDGGSEYRATIQGVVVKVRRVDEAIEVLIDAQTWPVIARGEGGEG